MINDKRVARSLDWLISNVRWGWLLMILALLGGQVLLTGEAPPNVLYLVAVVGSGLILNGIYAGLLAANAYPRWLSLVALTVDTAMVVTLLIMLNRQNLLLLTIMVFPVLIASLRWNVGVSLLALGPILLAHIGVILWSLVESDFNQPSTEISILVVNGFILFVLALLPGEFISRRLQVLTNRTLREETASHDAAQQGELVTQLAKVLSNTLNYRDVLEKMIELTRPAMGNPKTEAKAETVGLALLFDSETTLEIATGFPISRGDKDRRVDASADLIREAIAQAEAVVTNDLKADEPLSAIRSLTRCRSAICAPLRVGIDTYGVVLFGSASPNFYKKHHRQLLTTLCHQVVIPLENAQLIEDLHREQQKILAKEEEARRKLARDLHDGPTQSVSAIAMRLNFVKLVLQKNDPPKALDEIVKLEALAQKTIKELRTMLFTMRPVVLETKGLIAALEGYAERINANESFTLTVNNKGYNGQLQAEHEGVLFAIVEEAVGNAKKHARASRIFITTTATQKQLTVEIRDNGVGFDVEQTLKTYDQRSSLGMINLQERAQAIGGHTDIASERGRGTTITVQVPFG